MTQITLHIPDSSYEFFMELAKSLSFVKKIEVNSTEYPPTKQQVLNSITDGLQQVKEYREGKINLQTAQQLLDEL